MRIDTDGPVLTVTLDRPESLNALNWEDHEALSEAWTRLDRDDALWVGVIRAVPGRAFCAGADVKTLPAQIRQRREEGALPALPPRAFVDTYCRKPTICAVNGLALGLGAEIALACDIRVASERARFGLPEGRLGAMPGAGGTQRLPRAVGPAIALDCLLTARTLSGREAAAAGLVSRLVPDDQLEAETQHCVEELLGTAPLSAQAIKRAVHRGADRPLVDGLGIEAALADTLRDTEDQARGMSAFGSTVTPKWTGS